MGLNSCLGGNDSFSLPFFFLLYLQVEGTQAQAVQSEGCFISGGEHKDYNELNKVFDKKMNLFPSWGITFTLALAVPVIPLCHHCARSLHPANTCLTAELALKEKSVMSYHA